MVECRAISEKDRQLHPSLPPDIHYRATLIWVGPARPRNDKEDPNRNDTGIFQGMLTNIASSTDNFCRHLLLTTMHWTSRLSLDLLSVTAVVGPAWSEYRTVHEADRRSAARPLPGPAGLPWLPPAGRGWRSRAARPEPRCAGAPAGSETRFSHRSHSR